MQAKGVLAANRRGMSFEQPPASRCSTSKVRSSLGEPGLNSNHSRKVSGVIPVRWNVTVPLLPHVSPLTASQQQAIDHTLIRNGWGLPRGVQEQGTRKCRQSAHAYTTAFNCTHACLSYIQSSGTARQVSNLSPDWAWPLRKRSRHCKTNELPITAPLQGPPVHPRKHSRRQEGASKLCIWIPGAPGKD